MTCARNTSPLAVLLQQHSTALLAVAADVSTVDGRAAVLDAAIQKHGRLDVLVNNVGTNIRKASTEFTDDEYDLLCATNQGAPFHLSRHCFKHLAATQGCVVNISSISTKHDPTGIFLSRGPALRVPNPFTQRGLRQPHQCSSRGVGKQAAPISKICADNCAVTISPFTKAGKPLITLVLCTL